MGTFEINKIFIKHNMDSQQELDIVDNNVENNVQQNDGYKEIADSY